ncbi:MAG TPA: alpha/beta hydrolase [Bryobacteraceae bacterium]|nr:alpha/beta hydrolase [Bryobacteraceae bacterium]
MSFTTANGIRIAYDDIGDEEPALLFLPGWCVNRSVFRELISRTSPRRRSLALDWPGHGGSDAPARDFGAKELLQTATAVIEASGAMAVVPVALSHAGWVALELRRRLGRRIPKLVFLDWIVTEPPAPFLETLRGMQSAEHWKQTVEETLAMWLHGVDNPDLKHFVEDEIGSYERPMWARAAQEISAAYEKEGSPFQALSHLVPAIPVMHLYAQPADAAYLNAQQAFAASHPWFRVRRLKASSHFPMFEVPDEMAGAIEQFAA